MGVAKFEITRKCKICGEPFVAKTIMSWYCSPRCSKVAFKRRKDEEKRNERLDAIAKVIPKIKSTLQYQRHIPCLESVKKHYIV
jgi:endogenous inhibitor of DNA gyrase (YacG/DUF329 family)